ncbi:hypothetical protein HKD37_10G028178 [Glycine soja]
MTHADIQSSSNLLRFPFLVKILYKQRATKDVPSLVLFEQPSKCTLYLKQTTKDVPSLVFTITTKKLVASYTEFSDG